MICLYCRKEHDPAVGRLCARCGTAVLPPTPETVELARSPVRMEPPELREVDLK